MPSGDQDRSRAGADPHMRRRYPRLLTPQERWPLTRTSLQVFAYNTSGPAHGMRNSVHMGFPLFVLCRNALHEPATTGASTTLAYRQWREADLRGSGVCCAAPALKNGLRSQMKKCSEQPVLLAYRNGAPMSHFITTFTKPPSLRRRASRGSDLKCPSWHVSALLPYA